MVEHRPVKAIVAGSSPASGARMVFCKKYYKSSWWGVLI